MPETSAQHRKAQETRARIAAAALKLFVSQGYADTTIDQIAEAASVSRRTVFHHFATKDAMLFDHLAPQREVILRLLQERPPSEPPLVSLYSVMREISSEGHDRQLLAQVRAVITRGQTSNENLWGGVDAFQKSVAEMLLARLGDRSRPLEISAVTRMAFGWYINAAHFYLMENRRSLLECFDEVVAACADSVIRNLTELTSTVK